MISLKRNSKFELAPAKGLRSRNIYEPGSTKDFKISRGKFSDFLTCERCFYLDRVKGVVSPSLPGWSLNAATDELLKKEFDICRANKTPHRLFKDYDFCFHLAAGVGVQYIMENVSKALLTNIEATHIIIQACKENNIPMLITSTSEVYGTSSDEIWTEETKSLIGPPTKLRWSYAASKLIDEFLVLSEYNDNNLDPIVVRLFNIIGPNQVSDFGMVVPKFIEAAIQDRDIIIHGNGNQTRSFTWVDDVIEYFYLLSNKKLYGEIFNIGQTEEISIKNLAQLIIDKTNSKSQIIFKSHEEVFGKAFEDPKRRSPGIDKIIEFTGMKPTKNIEFMIENIINFKKNN